MDLLSTKATPRRNITPPSSNSGRAPSIERRFRPSDRSKRSWSCFLRKVNYRQLCPRKHWRNKDSHIKSSARSRLPAFDLVNLQRETRLFGPEQAFVTIHKICVSEESSRELGPANHNDKPGAASLQANGCRMQFVTIPGLVQQKSQV